MMKRDINLYTRLERATVNVIITIVINSIYNIAYDYFIEYAQYK